MAPRPKTKRTRTPKPVPKPTSSKRNDSGVLATNFARPLRWQIDYDYADRWSAKLSTEDRHWLAAFSDCFYGGDFRSDAADRKWSVDERRSTWRDLRVQRRDSYSLNEAWGSMDELPRFHEAQPLGDVSPTPAYLNDSDYKAAVAAFRATLDQTAWARDPVDSVAHRRASRRLRAMTPEPLDEDDLTLSRAFFNTEPEDE